MWAIDIVQQYNLFAQIMTANGNLRNVSFSSFWLKKKKNLQAWLPTLQTVPWIYWLILDTLQII